MGDRIVRVACSVVNGITIRLSKPGVDDGTGSGVKMPMWDGPPVFLKGPSSLHTGAGNTESDQHVINEVDGDWWDRWFEANKGHNVLVLNNLVQAGPEETKGENPTA